MNEFVSYQLERLKRRVFPFFDLTAWVLILVCFIPLFLIDRPMLLTLIQWSAFGLALAANALVVCRLLLPQIDLTEWVADAKAGSLPAAIVVASVTLLLSALFLGLVLWAKA